MFFSAHPSCKTNVFRVSVLAKTSNGFLKNVWYGVQLIMQAEFVKDESSIFVVLGF